MALSEENELKVCKILGVLYQDLEYQLALLSTDFTSERQTQVEAEIERWETAGFKFTVIKDNAANYGANIDPEREKDDIRHNIAILLERPDWANNAMSGTGMRLGRG